MNQFYEFLARNGWFFVGGLVGAIVHRIKNKMSWKVFLGTLITSGLIGLWTGILVRNYLGVPEEVSFTICSMAGVFARDILEELGEVVSMLSEYVKSKLFKNKKDDVSNS